jgi:hypothetical protein
MTLSSSRTPDETLYRTTYRKRTDGTLADAVVAALAAATNTAPTDIDPLYETVDPDALENLFGARIDGSDRERGRISFHHHNKQVVIDGTDILVRSATS